MLFIVSVDVEEIPLKGSINDYSTITDGVPVLLDLFHDFNIHATFFTTSNVARDVADTIREITKHNHEIACHGDHLTPLDFQNNLNQYTSLESATQTITEYTKIVPDGFRAPFNRINEGTLEALVKLGYKYDSSVMPSSRLLSRNYAPRAPKTPYQPSLTNLSKSGESSITEIPISTLPIAQLPLGLSYMRFLGLRIYKMLIPRVTQEVVTFYLHTYDLFSIPNNAHLPKSFILMYKLGNGLTALTEFLSFVSETLSPKFVPAKEVLRLQ